MYLKLSVPKRQISRIPKVKRACYHDTSFDGLGQAQLSPRGAASARSDQSCMRGDDAAAHTEDLGGALVFVEGDEGPPYGPDPEVET